MHAICARADGDALRWPNCGPRHPLSVRCVIKFGTEIEDSFNKRKCKVYYIVIYEQNAHLDWAKRTVNNILPSLKLSPQKEKDKIKNFVIAAYKTRFCANIQTTSLNFLPLEYTINTSTFSLLSVFAKNLLLFHFYNS